MLFLMLALVLGQVAPARGHDFVLGRGRAGHIEVGLTVDELFGRVGRENARLVDLNLEGTFSPAIEVKVPGGRGAVVAEIGEDFRIRRLQVRDSRFRTARGVGVGSTYAALRHAHGTHAPGQGEGAVYVVVRDLRMSFGFSYAGRGQRRPVELPDTAKVTHILVLPPAASDPKDPHAE